MRGLGQFRQLISCHDYELLMFLCKALGLEVNFRLAGEQFANRNYIPSVVKHHFTEVANQLDYGFPYLTHSKMLSAFFCYCQ